MYELYGVPKERFTGSNEVWIKSLHPDDVDRCNRELEWTKSGQKKYEAEFRIIHPDGSIRRIKALGTVLRDAAGQPIRMIGLNYDITQQKEDEEKLRNSETRYRSLFNTMNEGFCLHEIVVDQFGSAIDYTILDVNPAFEKILGNKKQDVVGKRATILFNVPSPPHLDIYAKVAFSGQSTQFETDFEPMRKSFRIMVFSPAKGMFATVFEDITDNKRAEVALRQSQEHFRSIIANADAGYLFVDKEGIIKDVNQAWARLYGYDSTDEIINQPFTIIQQSEDVEAARTLVEGIMKGDPLYCNGEFSRKCKDGSIGYHYFCARPVLASNEVIGIEGFIVDSTVKRKAEEQLKVQQSRTSAILAGIADTFYSLDTNWRFTMVNPAAEKAPFGRPAAQLLGKVIWDLYPCLIGTEIHQHYLNAAQEHSLEHYEAQSPLNGRWYEVFMQGWSGGVDIYMRDITERKRTEQVLQNTQKLEALGILAGGIAHDFNNLLGGIYGYIDVACETAKDPQLGQYLRKAMETIDRGRDLTHQLITFAKGGDPIRVVDRLIHFLRDTTQFALSGSNVSCKFEIQADLWACDYDKNQMSQVIDNIVINAKQAMPDGGSISIAAQNMTLAEKQHPVLSAGDYIKISIKDHGTGMPKDVLSRIFDPFFTTKSTGYGLGLATSYSIVKRHGGTIHVESESGKGSTFHIFLPAVRNYSSHINEKITLQVKGSGTFLIMDDEEVMRDVISEMLESSGYHTVCVENGRKAIEFFSKEMEAGRKIAGAIFDLIVPGGIGSKYAIEEIRKFDQQTPIFATSGHAEDPIIANPANFGFTGSISKPFIKAELLEMISKNTSK